MKKIIVFLLFTGFLFSQEIPSENYFWDFNNIHSDGIEATIGVKNCYVRQDSTTNSQLLDSLQIGNKIKVLKNTNEVYTIKGLQVSWVKIEYTKNNKTKTGYLWKGFIALGSITTKNTTFLTTFDSKFSRKIQQDDLEYDVQFYGISVKALNLENEIIAEKVITKQLSESYFFQNSVIGSWGLTNLNSVYRISFSGEACAIPTFYYYFGFDGRKFYSLPEKYEVGDANAYYHTEEFIFPKEKGGQPNTIIKNITDAENTDENLEGSTFLISKITEFYSWDGRHFKLIKTQKTKPFLKNEN